RAARASACCTSATRPSSATAACSTGSPERTPTRWPRFATTWTSWPTTSPGPRPTPSGPPSPTTSRPTRCPRPPWTRRTTPPTTGDWNGMRGCKDVFDNVADALGDLTMNLGAAVESSGSVWLGEAADHLCEHLKEIGDALTEAQEPVRKLAESHETAAEGAHALFGALADVLNDLIDDV